MRPLVFRRATDQDISPLLEMPPYLRSKSKLQREEIFLAESEGKILGAVSVSNRKISVVYGDWRDDFAQCLDNHLKEVTVSWISKLFVFPEYRDLGIGTRLVEEAAKSLEEKNVAEAFAGIHIKNNFKEVSARVFENNGFKRVGSCICSIPNGYCRGALFRKTLASSK